MSLVRTKTCHSENTQSELQNNGGKDIFPEKRRKTSFPSDISHPPPPSSFALI